MRPVRVPIPAAGTAGPVVPLDWYQVGSITLAVVDVNGAVSIDVEYTLDDVFDDAFDQTTANWFAVSVALTNAIADISGVLADANGALVKATAVRATNGGVGTAVFQVVQSGVMG